MLGNPQDILTTPYGYSGQMAPETAVAQQGLNRRRLIANMLMQQGMQPQQGQMVGRFYVPPSPVQHLAGLGSVLAGVLGSKYIDDQQGDLMKRDNEMVAEAVRAYPIKKYGQGEAVSQAPPRPEGPYQGEVGAMPMPEPTVQSSSPPIPAQAAPVMAGQPGMQGLDMANAAPGDMAQAGGTPPQALPPQQPTPQPAQPPMMLEGQPRQANIENLASLLTHQHPQVRAYGAMLMQLEQRQAEKDAERSFLATQKDADREVRREGIQQQAQNTLAQLENNLLTRQMMIDQAEKGSVRHAELMRQQQADKLEADKWKARLDAEARKSHDETLKEIAKIRADQKQVLTPQQEQKMKTAHANSYQALSSTVEKGDLALRKIESILDPKKSSAFNNLYGGYNAYLTERMPGQTQDIRNEIESLKANLKTLGFDLIRQSGSIGQMTEKEWPIVADQIAKLDNPRISEAEARSTIESIKNFILSHRNKTKEIYDMEWSDSPYYKGEKSQPSPAQPAPSGGASLEDLLKKYGQ